MTATTTTEQPVARASTRRATGFVLLGTAAVGLAGLIFTVVRVSWFTMTAPYCAGTTCTPATVAATDAIVPGRDALAAAGLYDGIELWLGYAVFTGLVFAVVLALLVAAAWALAGPAPASGAGSSPARRH